MLSLLPLRICTSPAFFILSWLASQFRVYLLEYAMVSLPPGERKHLHHGRYSPAGNSNWGKRRARDKTPLWLAWSAYTCPHVYKLPAFGCGFYILIGFFLLKSQYPTQTFWLKMFDHLQRVKTGQCSTQSLAVFLVIWRDPVLYVEADTQWMTV